MYLIQEWGESYINYLRLVKMCIDFFLILPERRTLVMLCQIGFQFTLIKT